MWYATLYGSILSGWIETLHILVLLENANIIGSGNSCYQLEPIRDLFYVYANFGKIRGLVVGSIIHGEPIELFLVPVSVPRLV